MRNTFIDFLPHWGGGRTARRRKTRKTSEAPKRTGKNGIHDDLDGGSSHRPSAWHGNVPNIIVANKRCTNEIFVLPKKEKKKRKERERGDGERARVAVDSVPWMVLRVKFLKVFPVPLVLCSWKKGEKIDVSDGLTQLLHKCQFDVDFNRRTLWGRPSWPTSLKVLERTPHRSLAIVSDSVNVCWDTKSTCTFRRPKHCMWKASPNPPPPPQPKWNGGKDTHIRIIFQL